MNIRKLIKKHADKHKEMQEVCRELQAVAGKVCKASTGDETATISYELASCKASDVVNRFERIRKSLERSTEKISDYLLENAEYRPVDSKGEGVFYLPDYSTVVSQDSNVYEWREAETIVIADSMERHGLDFVKTSSKRQDGGGSSGNCNQYKARDIKTGEVFDTVVLVRQYTMYHYPSIMDNTVKWWVHVQDGKKWKEVLTQSDYEYEAVDKVAELLGRSNRRLP